MFWLFIVILCLGLGACLAAVHHSIYFIAYLIGSRFLVNWGNLTFQGVLVLNSLRFKHS